MEAFPFVGIGVRLVAGIDDAPVQRGLERYLGFDVVSTLRNLEAGSIPLLPDTDATRTSHNLACHKERDQSLFNRGHIGVAAIQVVLMGSV